MVASLRDRPANGLGRTKDRSAADTAKRRGARADRDGDLAMGAATTRARGGISKSTPPTGPRNSSQTRDKARKPGRAIPQRTDALVRRAVSARPTTVAPSQEDEFRITGWANSKASTTSEDGGVSALITWLERKATVKSATKRPVKLKKKSVESDLLVVAAPRIHSSLLLRLDGYEFAGKQIKVELIKEDDTTNNTIAMLRGVLARRYNADLKLLDLSALGQDPDLKASAIFDSKSTTSKFFPAMMKVLDKQFATQAEKNEAIQSVSLASNELANLTAVTTLSHTLPQLKNLDLSNNQFATLENLDLWRRRFAKLDHLVLASNPVMQTDPNVIKTLTSWYPQLRMLNDVQVRTDEEAARAIQVVDLPFPIRTAHFQDEGQIAENFIRTFFTGFDGDRLALAKMYYDVDSTFSFAVNTNAPRDPQASDDQPPQEWGDYIKSSRNLKKITHPPPRLTRLHTGVDSIIQGWSVLPTTRHPDLALEAKKWMIECHLQPGLPDPTGQSAGGVDGFNIVIHGEYYEMDVSTGQPKKQRSFDRTFLIGPGGPSGVRVVNDMLVVRAYGGIQAFEPNEDAEPASSNGSLLPALPSGLTPELAEQMVLELQKQTKMTIAYAKDCLEQVAWDFSRALETFAAVKANLPAEAFVDGIAP